MTHNVAGELHALFVGQHPPLEAARTEQRQTGLGSPRGPRALRLLEQSGREAEVAVDGDRVLPVRARQANVADNDVRVGVDFVEASLQRQ